MRVCRGWEGHINELLTYVPLYYFLGEESNSIFSTGLKPFFDFSRKVKKFGSKARNEGKQDLQPFEDAIYPMDMSAKHKCFDWGR